MRRPYRFLMGTEDLVLAAPTETWTCMRTPRTSRENLHIRPTQAMVYTRSNKILFLHLTYTRNVVSVSEIWITLKMQQNLWTEIRGLISNEILNLLKESTCYVRQQKKLAWNTVLASANVIPSLDRADLTTYLACPDTPLRMNVTATTKKNEHAASHTTSADGFEISSSMT